MVIILRIIKYIKNSLAFINKNRSINHAIKYPIARTSKLSGKEKKKAENAIIDGVTLK